MPLVPYNVNVGLKPFGLHNSGAICYFNSMLQSLLSCTAFINEVIKNKEQYSTNPVVKKIIELIELSNKLKSPSENHSAVSNNLSIYSVLIWNEMAMFICKKNKININEFMSGQQCSREAFDYLMECMESFKNIKNIFLHRYKNNIYCLDCNKCVSSVNTINSIILVEPHLQNDQISKFKVFDNLLTANTTMNSYIEKQTGYIDSFYICPTCKKTGEKYNINYLTMIPEVLVVLSKKYRNGEKLNVYTEFPKELEFNGINNTKLKFHAVSQIEHAGSLNGGHYWANSRRSDGWYCLNDNGVSKSDFLPTNNTYMVFYHLESLS